LKVCIEKSAKRLRRRRNHRRSHRRAAVDCPEVVEGKVFVKDETD